MEACIQLLREIILGEVVHISSIFFTVLGVIGSVASIISLILYIYEKKKK